MLKLSHRWAILASASILLLSLIACSTITGLAGPTSTPTAAVSIGESQGSGGEGSPSTNEQNDSQPNDSQSGELPSDSDMPQGTASCLIGTWKADSDSLAAYMQDAFTKNSQGQLDIQVSHTGGDLFLTFAEDGTMTMASDGAQFGIAIANLANITVTVNAEGTASYAADAENIGVWNPDYASTASGEGQVLSLPKVSANAELTLTPDQLFAYAESDSMSYSVTGAPPSAHVAPYTCQGDTLVSGPPEYAPISWTRTP
jgi:hypothetical protein